MKALDDRRRSEFPRPHPLAAAAVPALLLAAALGGAGGCERADRPLRPGELAPAERLYVERFVTLERARALALADSARGAVVLDSLAAAWGDSALPRLLRDLPQRPRRLAAVHDLLARLLEAERDSLVIHPRRRLWAPLPPPAPPRAPLSAP